MKALPTLIFTLGILLLISSTNFAQTNSLHYQNFVSLSDSTSNDTLIMKAVPIPSINVGDIVGQSAAGPISGMIFAVLGGVGGYIIEPTTNDGPSLAVVIGALAGYTFGSAVGVYAVARKDKYDPNLGILIGSSLLGEIAGILLYSNNDYTKMNLLAYSPFILPPIFAIVTLNAFQQKKSNITVGFDVQQLLQPNAYSYGMKLQYEF